MNEIRLKEAKKALRRLAGNPDREKIEGNTLFEIPIMEYDKEDLVCWIIAQEERIKNILGEKYEQFRKLIGRKF